jgi:hypothetical protein
MDRMAYPTPRAAYGSGRRQFFFDILDNASKTGIALPAEHRQFAGWRPDKPTIAK